MSEHDEQRALFEWAAWNEGKAPELRLLHAIPNGGHRHPAVAAKMRAEGVKAGVLDCFLPVARRDYHGAWVELKFGKNKLTPEQEVWARQLGIEGYYVTVCWSWVEAARTLVWYLGYQQGDFGL